VGPEITAALAPWAATSIDAPMMTANASIHALRRADPNDIGVIMIPVSTGNAKC
jgi:hypothetical protein